MPQYINETITAAGGDSQVIDWPGGPGAFAAAGGNFGGISVALKFQINGSQWVSVQDPLGNDLTFSDHGMGTFEMFPCKMQVQGTGGTEGPINVKIRVAPIWQGWFNEPGLL